MRIKDIFTSRDCRRCMRIALKLFFTKLPIVKDICEMRQANKLTKKLVKKDRWERYTIIKKIEDETNFRNSCINVWICSNANVCTEEDLENARNDALSNYLIDQPKYANMKKYVEGVKLRRFDTEHYKEILEIVDTCKVDMMD